MYYSVDFRSRFLPADSLSPSEIPCSIIRTRIDWALNYEAAERRNKEMVRYRAERRDDRRRRRTNYPRLVTPSLPSLSSLSLPCRSEYAASWDWVWHRTLLINSTYSKQSEKPDQSFNNAAFGTFGCRHCRENSPAEREIKGMLSMLSQTSRETVGRFTRLRLVTLWPICRNWRQSASPQYYVCVYLSLVVT